LDEEMTNILHFIKELGKQNMKAFETGDLIKFGELMNIHFDFEGTKVVVQ
jgi:mevalonate kinase